MMTNAERRQTPPPTLPLRTVALVGRRADRHLQDMMRAEDYDVVFVESTAHAYSRIKRVRPDLVILWLSTDDADACRVLSMLALDAETCRIPVVTCFTPGVDDFCDGESHEAHFDDAGSFAGSVSLN